MIQNITFTTLSMMEIPESRIEFRSLESPTVSLNDPSAFDFLGIGTQPIAAGVRVDRRTILTLDSWWRGVSLISGSISRLPLYVYKGKRSGTNTIDQEHPAYRLLYQRPNDRQHANYFKKCLLAHVLNHGNAYAYIVRDGGAKPLALHLLAPDRTYPILVEGRLWYVSHIYTNTFGGADGSPDNKNQPIQTTMLVIDPDDMLHIKGLGYDGLQGYTVYDMAAESAGHALATRQYSARFFANNAEPRLIITLPVGQNWRRETQQEFLRQWNMMHSGVSSAHRTALITNGADVKQVSVDAEKSQLIEQRRFELVTIANFLGLPPHKLGDDSRTSYNSVEIENQSLVNDCYASWMDEVCRECEVKLLSEREKETYSHFIGFDASELMQPDAKTAAEADSLVVNNGLATLDEIRAKRNQPAAPNGIGKKWRIPVNIGIINEETGEVQGIPQKQGDMDRPAGTKKPADQKSKRARIDKTAAGELINPGWVLMRKDELRNLSHPEHCECVTILDDLHVKYVGNLNGRKVMVVSFDIAARRFEQPDLVVAGNHEKWDFIPPEQFWVDSGVDFADAAHDLLHEATEECIMRVLGWKYDDAHNFANEIENAYIDELLAAAKEKQTAFTAATRAVVADAAKRIYVRLSQDCQRAAKKPERFTEWEAKAQSQHYQAVAEILSPSLVLLGHDPQRASHVANTSIDMCVQAKGDESRFSADKITELLCQLN